MYGKDFLGVGIVTCNRKDSFMRLFDEVHSNSIVDCIAVVKNKDFDYGEYEPSLLAKGSLKTQTWNVKEDVGVGYCKNICLKHLLAKQCQHIFLIEDDINIKNGDVFKYYIDAAKSFNLQHLNFCMAWDSITKQYLKPSYALQNKAGAKLSIFSRLCGDFEYFTYDALIQVGIFDAKHYVNALEHAEHTYRLSLAELTTPFFAFADAFNSTDYIEDTGIESSIHYDAQSKALYEQRVRNAGMHFAKTYGKVMSQLVRPQPKDVQQFLQRKELERNG